MTDKKISELDAITGSNTAATDVFVVVDTSTGQTKKITREELNNAIEQDVLSTVDINGGTIDGTTIGATTAAAGSFTTVDATNNITVGGTVDGRDVAADGTKLDGIEASATADQTGAQIATALNGETISSLTALTTTGAVIVGGDFTVNGTTTTINSTTLEVDDKNIVLASGAADAAAANGSGITIDGASATFTYVSTGDKWQLNKPLDVGGSVTADAISLNPTTGYANIEMGGPDGSYIDLKSPFSDDYDGRIITTGTDLNITTGSGSGSVVLQHQNATKLSTTATGVDVTGIAKASLGFQFGNSYLYEGATDEVNMRIGTDGPYLEFLDAGSDVAEVGNASGPLALTASGTERMRIDSSGNVGIGTSSPAYELDVAGDARANTFYFRTNTASIPASVGGFYRPSLGDVAYGFNTNELFRITSTGLVGIGTLAPQKLLEIASGNSGGDAALDSPTFRIKNTTQSADWDAEDVVGTIEYYSTDSSGNSPYVTSFIKSVNEQGNGTLPSGALTFGTATYNASGGAVERMRIDSSGNVGIGTTSPAYRIDIQGSSNNALRIKTSSPLLRLEDSDDNAHHTFIGSSDDLYITSDAGNTGAGNMIFRNGGSTERMRIDSGGNVGIDTSSVFSPLHVGSGEAAPSTSGNMANNGLTISNGVGGRAIQIGVDDTAQGAYIQSGYVNNSNAANNLSFYSGASRSMTIDSSGNVGIGTDSPEHALHVSGNGFGTMAKFSSDDGTNNPRLIVHGSSAGMHLQGTSSTGASDLIFETSGAEGSGSERMRIAGNGNVTINSSPVATLSSLSTFNGVGSYCLAHHTSSNSSLTANASVSGSSLRAVGFYHLASNSSSSAYYPDEDGSSLSGTWRVMGEARDNSSPTTLRPATLFVRIS